MKVSKVTRTITSVVCVVQLLNLETQTCFEETISLTGTVKNEESLIQAVKDLAEEKTGAHFVRILSRHFEENLYVMSEQEFIEHAEKKPARKNTEKRDVED